MLAAADRLFYRGGIRATSVDAVADEAGVTKRTLYHHFESKDDLVSAYLTRRDEPTRKALVRRVETRAQTAAARILLLFDMLEGWFESHDYRGCPFLNAAAECAGDERVRLAAATHKDGMQRWLTAQLAQASADDPDAAARMLMVAVDGAMARALIYRGGENARTGRKIAALVLASAGVELQDVA